MKRILKAILPAPVLQALREARLQREWNRAARQVSNKRVEAARPARSLLILPSDQTDIVGAVGDDAMISAVIGHFRAGYPDLRVSLLCRAGAAEAVVRGMGAQPVVMPSFNDFPGAISAILAGGGFDALVCLGADMMDGYYNPERSAEILITSDLAARAGMRAIILGFSFNAAAMPELAPCFARLDRRVAVNVRDRTSLERLQAFAAVPQARLVADAAFTLPPGDVDARTRDWIAAERAAGRRVIGINLHPMLVRNAGAGQIELAVAEMAKAIGEVSAQGPLSWLLVAHDYREDMGIGDMISLRPLYERLSAQPGIRCRLFEGRHRAATLKALAGLLDGVVTGRMHLAIAALGMGTPVMCLTYQDKFEGLFRHFGLPSSLLLPPEALERPGALAGALGRFLADLPGLTETVARERPKVLALAEANFAPEDGA